MSAAPASLEAVFGADGPIARALPGFEGRPGQVRMSQLVERGFLEGAHTIVEAGTGVGKSLAYLVPAARSGKKIVVSTGTIALQEQLVGKDIPLVLRALGVDLRVELLKGRNHYLCKAKLDRLRSERLVASSGAMEHIWNWAGRTTTGDRSELAFAPSAADWEQLDADADDCVGELCDRYADCFFFKRRDAARYADIVVVNHALFFLDLAMGGALLPSYDVAILDEAHQCERWATAALTSTISQQTLGRMMRRLHRTYALPSTFDAEFDEGVRRLASALATSPATAIRCAPTTPRARRSTTCAARCIASKTGCTATGRPGSSARSRTSRRPSAAATYRCAASPRTSRRSIALRSPKTKPSRGSSASRPRAATRSTRRRSTSPTSCATRCSRARRASCSPARRSPPGTRSRSCAPRSASTRPRSTSRRRRSTTRRRRAFTSRRPAATRRTTGSPPGSRRSSRSVSNSRGAGRSCCSPRTRGCARCTRCLRERLTFPTKLQGELPRAHLLDWFRTTRNAVLFGTGTFWEGIDVVGDQLSCVIIDRLPFPSPGDPLVAARMAAIEAAGRGSFEEYMIPAAIVRLKQGFGRLIRSKADRGIVALLDGRIGSMRYGATILDALPPARRVEDLTELRGFLDRLRLGALAEHLLAVHPGLGDLDLHDLVRIDLIRVAFEDREVGVLAGLDRAEAVG